VKPLSVEQFLSVLPSFNSELLAISLSVLAKVLPVLTLILSNILPFSTILVPEFPSFGRRIRVSHFALRFSFFLTPVLAIIPPLMAIFLSITPALLPKILPRFVTLRPIIYSFTARCRSHSDSRNGQQENQPCNH
jgi:hypothetical protein